MDYNGQKISWSISSEDESLTLKRNSGYLLDVLYIAVPSLLLLCGLFFLTLVISAFDIVALFCICFCLFNLFVIYAILKTGRIGLKRIVVSKRPKSTIFYYLFGLKRKLNENPSHILFKFYDAKSEMMTNIVFKGHKHIIITLSRVFGSEKDSLERSIQIAQPFLNMLGISYKTEI